MASASMSPSVSFSVSPSLSPSLSFSASPSKSPSVSFSASPSVSFSKSPSVSFSRSPSVSPSASPSVAPYTVSVGTTVYQARGLRVITWDGLRQIGDIGAPVACGGYPIKSIHVSGDLNGGTITIQGSNRQDKTGFVTLNDLAGTSTALTFTAAGIKGVREHTFWIRPILSGAANIDVVVTLLMFLER